MGLETKLMLAAVLAFMGYTRYFCYDRLTWWLETAPVLIALPPIVLTSRKFPLTTLMYSLLTLHAFILMWGAEYSYAKVPLGYFLQNLFGLKRNCYDRIGHWFQGFVPAILAREILARKTPLQRGWRFAFITSCICLAFSAFYELLEWWGALALEQKADDFLGSQGDVWDSQWDMFLALLGSVCAQLVLGKWHNRQVDAIIRQQKSSVKKH